MRYKTFRLGVEPPELIIEDGITYIKVDEKAGVWSGIWPGIEYERLDVVRAKDYDPTRSAFNNSEQRFSRSSGRYSDGNSGSYHYIVDEGGIYEPKHSPPLNESLWQACLYHNIMGKDDGIRGWPA